MKNKFFKIILLSSLFISQSYGAVVLYKTTPISFQGIYSSLKPNAISYVSTDLVTKKRPVLPPRTSVLQYTTASTKMVTGTIGSYGQGYYTTTNNSNYYNQSGYGSF